MFASLPTLKRGHLLVTHLKLFIILILMSHLHTIVAYKHQDCDELTFNTICECMPELGELKISCPERDPQMTLMLKQNDYVQIECNSMDTNYTLRPNITIGDTPLVKIKGCPLPESQPIMRILEHLGITKVNRLRFQDSEPGINLTSQHLKGLQGVERLHFINNGIRHIPADLFTDLKNLSRLDLRWNNIDLSADFFAPLENLRFLELGDNDLKNLPSRIFRNQRRLMALNLWGNKLQNLSKSAFEGVSSINDLDLSTNGIEFFEPNVFELLTNLSKIDLRGNNFTKLPEGLFSHNKNLTLIYLTNNRVPLKTLPAGFLANLPNLREVRLTCDLETLPGDLFANSSAITNMTISGNKLTSLPETLLWDQYNLYDLDLRWNRLSALPDELFKGARNLRVLHLSYNQLTEISNNLFESQRNLELLYVDNNRLALINVSAFSQTQNLRLINMQNNQLNLTEAYLDLVDNNLIFELSSPFQKLEKLTMLNLRNNSVMHIFKDWKHQLTHLRKLDLSYNNITSLTENDLQYVTTNNLTVNLKHNQIRSVKFFYIETLDFTNSSTTVSLDLNHNPLHCDCLLLQFVQFVNGDVGHRVSGKIKIDSNELVCAEPQNLAGKTIRGLNPMKLVCPFDHHDSKQKQCPRYCECSVRSFDFVLMVNCSTGNLTKVPNLPRLEPTQGLKAIELYIEHNQLTELPKRSMQGYDEVTKIYAANNNISQIGVTNLPLNLSHLDVSGNQLKGLNVTVLNFLNESRSLDSLHFSQNPWKCDCSARELLQFTQANYKRISDLSVMRCEGPLQKRTFIELTPGEICPAEEGWLIAVAVVIALFGLLIGITAALYYKYQEEIKAWLYFRSWCLRCVTEEDLDQDKTWDAFISYSHKDAEFVAKYLVPELENGPMPFKLCDHERDFVVGGYIPDQIAHAVDNSRRTIVVLSQNFITSEWTRMEFKAAHQAAMKDGLVRIIPVILGDISDIESLDNELNNYLKKNTWLKWGDPSFFQRLRYAMPHRSKKFNRKTSLKESHGDELELTQPSAVTPPLTSGTKAHNGHINGTFIVNTHAKQTDV